MTIKKIRPTAICIFKHNDSILLYEGIDPSNNTYFYRPIGGGIEYGETSEQALIREMKEEINADIEDIRLLGIIESIFTFEDELGHEIVFVYDAKFIDQSFYNKETFYGLQDDGSLFKLLWVNINDCLNDTTNIVPKQLKTMITDKSYKI